MALMPSLAPMSAPLTQASSPRCMSDEPAWESEAEQCVQDIISQDDETSAVQHVPEPMVALVLPDHMCVLPAWVVAPCLSQDEPMLLVGTALARAAAYIKEWLARRLPQVICDTSPLGDMEEPPSKATEAENGQHETDAVREGTTRMKKLVPYDKIALTLPVSLLTCPMQANAYHKPLSESKHNRRTLGPSSAPVSPASPNNGPTSSKVDRQPSLPFTKTQEGREERLLVEELEITEWPGQVTISAKTRSPCQRIPEASVDCLMLTLKRQHHAIINEVSQSALMPCSTEGPPSMVVETKMGRCRMNIISKETTSTIECSPHAIAAPKIAYTSQAWPMQAESLCQPTDELTTSFIKDCCHIVNETSRQTALTPCSPQPELSAPSPSGFPASPNNDILSNEIICQFSHPSEETREDVRGELLVKAVCEPMQLSEETPIKGDPFKPKLPDATAAKWPDQEVVSGKTTNITLRSPYAIASHSSQATQPIRCSEAIQQEPMVKACPLLTKMSGSKEKQPKQAAVSKTRVSTYTHSPESIAALTPPISEPVNQPPAYCPRSSPQIDTRLRWKLPDHGENKR
jgi:hypothetical protein